MMELWFPFQFGNVWWNFARISWSLDVFSYSRNIPTYNLLEFLLLITCCLNYVIFPSFYLLADFRFRNTFYQKGSFQAVWSALKQNYEKNSNDNELEMQVMSWNSSIVKKICCCWSLFVWKYVCVFWITAFENQSINNDFNIV